MFRRCVMFIIIPIAFMLNGCNSDDHFLSTIQSKPEHVSLSASSKADNNKEFFPGDAIGIYPVTYDLEGRPGIIGDISNRTNIMFVYDGIRWYTKPGRELFLEENSLIDIYAYYPYDDDIGWTPGKTDPMAYPFSVEGNQAFFNADFMWAKKDLVGKGSTNVLLEFSHLMSRIRVNLVYESYQEDPELTIHNSKVACAIDLSNGSVRLKDRIAPIKPKLLFTTGNKIAYTYEAFIIPQQISEGTPLMSMKSNGVPAIYSLPKDMDFQAGHSYEFNLNISTLSRKASVTGEIKDEKI